MNPIRRRRLERLAPFAACLLIIAAASPVPAVGAARRYLVMPFENQTSERSLNWLGEAIAMSLSDRLEALGMRTVSRGERLDALDALGLPSSANFTLATTLRLAEAVRAARLVTGSFTYDPANGVAVSARLLDAEAMRQVWEGKRPGTLAGIFALMDPLALEAAAQDETRMADAAAGALGSISDPPLPLYEIIVRGLQENEPDRRVAALEKGLELNRQSRPLLRALAFALYDAGRPDEAVVKLDAAPADSFPDGWRLHLLRARILLAKGDAEGATAALGRSIAAGDSADAHVLLARIHVDRGDLRRAQAEMDLAAGLDPNNPDLIELRTQTDPNRL